MRGWILDTNVLSELRKKAPDGNVVAFVEGLPLEELYVSDVTFAEIRFGIEQAADARKRAELHEWLENTLRPMFHARVLPISEDVMLRWRLLVEEGRKVGHTFSLPDLIIAATGLHFGMTVVTRNTSDFERTGVLLHDAWRRGP